MLAVPAPCTEQAMRGAAGCRATSVIFVSLLCQSRCSLFPKSSSRIIPHKPGVASE